MRTTFDLPEPMFRQLKSTAALRGVSMKALIITALARELELQPQPTVERKNGFPVFQVPQDAPPITLEDVKKDEDEP